MDSLKQEIVHLKQPKTGKRTWAIIGSPLCYNMRTYMKYTVVKPLNWPQQLKQQQRSSILQSTDNNVIFQKKEKEREFEKWAKFFKFLIN